MATALSELRENGFRASGVSGPGRIALTQMDLFAGLPERDLILLDSRLPLVRWPRGARCPSRSAGRTTSSSSARAVWRSSSAPRPATRS